MILMSRKLSENPQAAALIAELVELGSRQTPKLTMAEMAARAGIRPETLSRMKKNGRGDISVVIRLAAMVGKRLALADMDTLREQARTGEFFDVD